MYTPHRNLSTNSIYRRLECLMREVGDYRDPITAYFLDLTDRIKTLEKNLLVVGGYFNVHAHHEEYSRLLQDTNVRDVNKLNDMHLIPTYKRSSYHLDKILISDGLIDSSSNFNIAPFDLLFLSDHSALVLDLNLRSVVTPPLPNPNNSKVVYVPISFAVAT